MDPRPYAKGSLREVFAKFPHIGAALPAMGYSPAQVWELEATIRATPCDTVIDATPVTLSRLVKLNKPLAEVDYELRVRGPVLEHALNRFAERAGLKGKRR